MRLPDDGLTWPAAFSAGTLAETSDAGSLIRMTSLARVPTCPTWPTSQPGPATTASFLCTPSARARRDRDARVEEPERTADHVGGDVAVPGEPEVRRGLRERELLAQGLRVGVLLRELCVALAQDRVLR